MSGREKIGVAVVGLGVGEQHARAYLRTGRCELRWLHDLDRLKAQQFAAELGHGRVANDFEEILRDSQTDAISIASYDDAHFTQVVAALNAGKHVFVEKPICRTVDELRVIKRAWLQHGGKVKLSSNLVLRAAPIYGWLKQEIAAGDFGELYAFDGEYLYGRLHKITEGWRKDVEDYSVIAGGGIHLIDLLLWLTNQRPTNVMATGNRICAEDTAFRYKDYVAVTLQHSSGLIARICANFGCVHRHQHVLRIYGSTGTFFYDDAGARCHASRNPETKARQIDLPALPASKGELIHGFVDSVLRDTDERVETQTHFDAISIVAACDESLKSDTRTEVEYI